MLTKIRSRLSTRVICGIILALIFGIALSLRIFVPYDSVLAGDWVRFGGNDPWYHMRLVENLLQHFPHRIAFDPFTFYPHGQAVYFAPFYDLLLGFVAWITGWGHPSQHTIATIAAYLPAILGALVTIPVYFIGKELFNRKVGLLSAALIAILPGQFLIRSLLGFSDHHVAEVLFSTVMILFLILALKRAKEKEITFKHIWSRDWRNIRKPLLYALLAGITLGIYILSWVGGLLFVFILFSYAILQYIIDHLRGKSTDYLCIIGVPIFLIALIMIIPFLNQLALGTLCIVSLIVTMLIFPVLSGISWLMESRNMRRAFYPLALAGLGLAGLGFFYLINPSLLSSMLGQFDIFAPGAGKQTIAEVQGLFSTPGGFWRYFTTSFPIALISLILITYAVTKKVSAEKILLLTWSLIMLVAVIGQVRFAYYFAVNAALLSGYFCWRIPGWVSGTLDWIGFREPYLQPKGEKAKDLGKKKKPKGKKPKMGRAKERWGPRGFITRYFKPRYVSAALAVIIVFFLAFYWPICYPTIQRSLTYTAAQDATVLINDDWHDALLWMRDNTPDPFQDPDFYYELYERPPAGEDYDYPQSAYGVMNWWDYGHWITEIAHRIPNSNPHQEGAVDAALFFTAQDESSANEILNRLGSRYVIIDYEMATRKFGAMSIWAGENQSLFSEIYYQRTGEGVLEPITLYYPQYYQSMCCRLYNFGGQAVVPDNSTWVISYTEKTAAGGNSYKEITTMQRFPTYEEAKAFIDANPGYIIVGKDRFRSPVRLDKLEHYELIYKSDTTVVEQGDKTISYVEIFKYDP